MSVYVVTGGAGFIGSHLVEALVKRGEQVRVVDNFSTGKRAHLTAVSDQLELCELDIRDLEGLRRAFQGVEYVIHQAAVPSVPLSVENPLQTHEVSATGTLNVLIAAREAGVKRVVYASSSSVYGDDPAPIQVESRAPAPLSPYAAAKLAGENYCKAFTAVYGLETVSLRYFNVFGARQDPASPYSAVIPIFMSAMLRGKAPTIYGDGTQTRDFVFVQNVVEANLLACHADSKAAGAAMNLACGDRITLIDLVRELNDLMGLKIAPIFAPPRPGDIKHSCADIRLAGELLGYEPRIGLREGLAHTLEWFKNS